MHKRKPFFIKGNFQIVFIIGFALLLLSEIVVASLFIYKLSNSAIEETAFKSHISLKTTSQIIGPIIFKVNLYIVSIGIFIAGIITAISYIRMHNLFAKLVEGLNNIRDNKTGFRIGLRGTKNTRRLIAEFNQAADYIDKRLLNLKSTLNSLLGEKDLKRIEQLHNKLYSVITEKEIRETKNERI